MRSEED